MYLSGQKNRIGKEKKEVGCLPATLILIPVNIIRNSYQLQWNRIRHWNYKELWPLKDTYKMQLLKLATRAQAVQYGISAPILHSFRHTSHSLNKHCPENSTDAADVSITLAKQQLFFRSVVSVSNFQRLRWVNSYSDTSAQCLQMIWSRTAQCCKCCYTACLYLPNQRVLWWVTSSWTHTCRIQK